MRFRVVWMWKSDKKTQEALADREAAFNLWFFLEKDPHLEVAVYNLSGRKCEPEKGIHGLVDYNPYIEVCN